MPKIDKTLLEKYGNLNWNKLLRKDLGEYNLDEAKPIFDRIKDVFDSLLKNPALENISQNFTNQISSELTKFLQLSENVVNSFQNTNERPQWIEKIRNQEHSIIVSLGHYFNYLTNIDPSKNEELKRYIVEAGNKVKELGDKLKTVDELVEGARKTAQKAEIQSFGSFFGDCAKDNKVKAIVAFWLMMVSIIATMLLSIGYLQNIHFIKEGDMTIWENLLNVINSQNIIIKIVIISLAGYLIAHFSKVYSAEKHLYVINTQRQNALNSHRQILKSIQSTGSENDLETANAILLQVTRAIFDNQDTGYLKDANSPTAPMNQILEITKTVKK
jgi:hypothetical protein